MRQKVQKIITHPLISGSTVIFIGSFIASLLNYFYNILMGRMLSEKDFGLLISLTSILILVSLFSSSFANVFTKLTAEDAVHKGKSRYAMIITQGGKYIFYFTFIFSILYLVATPMLMNYLHIKNGEYVIIILLAMIGTLLLSLPTGILQGKLKFYSLSFVHIVQPFIKIFFALLLVSAGLAVTGALSAIALSMIVPAIILGFILLRKSKKHELTVKEEGEFRSKFTHYSYTFFLAGIGTALLSNTDIIIVPDYFAEVVSGQYAALSLMGKAIFYLTNPINFVFFPLIAQKKERNENLLPTVALALILILGSSLFLSAIYFFFPSLILTLFFPSESYRVLAQYLGPFSLYIVIFSLCSLLSNYFLSSGSTGIYKLTLISGILQILLITLFHQSISQVILVLLVNSLILLILQLFYYVKTKRN